MSYKRRGFVMVLIGIFAVLSSAIFYSRVFGYDTNVAHPYLTERAVDKFSAANFGKIDYEKKQWIINGAVEEDTPIRWMNHFYNPNTGNGLFGFDTAKGWSQDPGAQNWYAHGDQSWQKAVMDYVEGDYEASFIALGHVLHLVEDMAVPAHTRLDIHIKGDPYEQWVKRNANTPIGDLPIEKFNDIGEYFDRLASYSSNNFLSEDTIDYNEISELSSIIINDNGEFVKCKMGQSAQKRFCLIKYNEDILGRIRYSFDDPIVNSDYHTLLAPKAVSYAAGVIDLFFREVEKKKQELAKEKEMRGIVSSWFVSLITNSSVDHAVGQSAGEFVGRTGYTAVNAPPDFSNSPAATPLVASPSLLPPAQNLAPNASPISPKVVPVPPVVEPVVVPTTTAPPVAVSLSAPNYSGGGGSGGNSSGENLPSTGDTDTDYSTSTADTTPPHAPTLSSQFYEIIYTTSTDWIISGTHSTDTVKIIVSVSSTPASEIIAGSSAVFEYATVLSSGHNYFSFVGVDVAGNISTAATAHLVLDNDAPPIPSITVASQASVTSSDIHLFLSGADALSPQTYYDVAVRQASSSEWADIATATTSAELDFIGVRGQSYFFRARAFDSLGHFSDWSAETSTTVDWSRAVVINEVAWAGTGNVTTADEWLEFYNNTDADIFLASTNTGQSYQIKVNGQPLAWKNIYNSVIPAHGYYLLERTNDDTVKYVSADATFTLSAGLNNNGAKLELFNSAGEKIDEVDCSAGWFAGGGSDYRSMERLDTLGGGNISSNWQSSQGPRVTPRTSRGAYVYGSPKLSNFGNILLMETQQDTTRTFTKNNSPYILWYYTVPAGRTLIIEAGTVIKSFGVTLSDKPKLEAYGNIEVSGTADDKVIFTSGRDQSFAQDSYNTIFGTWATTTAPASKDWQGIQLRPGAVGVLNNFELRYGGAQFSPPGAGQYTPKVEQSLRADNATVNVAGGRFSDNSGTAVYLKSSSSTIAGSEFINGTQAVEADVSQLVISDSSFANFSGPKGPVYIKDNLPALSNLAFLENSIEMPYFGSITLGEGAYDITADVPCIYSTMVVPVSSTLNIAAGTQMNFASTGVLEVRGALNTFGTAENNVVFRPYPDTTYWGQVKFIGSTSTLRYTRLEKGNAHISKPAHVDGMILSENSALTLENVTVWDISEYGNVAQFTNTVLSAKDSSFGDAEKSANPSLPNRGIKATGGILALDNANIQNVNFGILANSQVLPMPVFTMSNMSSSSFTNVDRFWVPEDWAAF